MTSPSESGTQPKSGRDILGHPRGLATLAGTELWERISFHGMVALLTLYLAEQLLLPGHIERIVGFGAYRHILEWITGPLSVEALATQTFGLYIGLIYFTPLLGGLIGDRLLGRRAAVILGCVLMTLGHFSMAFDQSFLLALLLLILGAGFLRGNLIAQVGGLYRDGDTRSTHAMQIYYSMVNLGAFVAPLITGALGQSYGWHYGFGFAGIGMLLGLIIYLVGAPHLPRGPPWRISTHKVTLNHAERHAVMSLMLLMPLLTLYWVVNAQEWNTYNLWARDHVNLSILGWHMPVPWVQSLSSLTAVALVPVVLLFWRWLAASGREPDEIGKLALGCLIMGAFTACDALSTVIFGAPQQVPLLWIVITGLGESFGYLHVQPVAIALFAKMAPPSMKAMMIGVYFLNVFFGGLISGRLGALYEHWSATNFWLLHALIVCTAGLLIPVFGKSLRASARSDRLAVA
jgi:proton-dependent oligopeptide transporter, POT family